MKNRQALFWPQHVEPESSTFSIDYGKQMTVYAVGLEANDEITFQILHVPSIDPDHCACPPGAVTMPAVAGYAPLMCCGTEVKLTATNPFVIIDAPQRVLLRAVLKADSPENNVWAWVTETETHNVTDRMRGCGC